MWKKISEEQPPKGKVLKTKIDYKGGIRNEQDLTGHLRCPVIEKQKLNSVSSVGVA